MVERSQRRTVPQIFIDEDSIGGYDDLAHLNATRELDRLLEIAAEPETTKVYDVVIIGAGPAGMSAAIYAARKNLSTIVIAYDLGGQMGTTHDIANYTGYQMVTGHELVKQFATHADQYGIEKLLGERVANVTLDGRCKVVTTESGREIRASALIVASGAFKRKLNIPGEKELQGKGVVDCSTCDGPLFRDRRIAVIGGGNSALEAAIEMNGLAEKVYLVSIVDWSADQILQDKTAAAERVEAFKFHEALEINGSDKVEGLTVKNVHTGETRRLDVDGVFIEIGLFPNSDFVVDLLETNERGEIKVDRHSDTGARGVFATGDVTDNREKQIVVSAGEGARAALSAFEHLVKQV